MQGPKTYHIPFRVLGIPFGAFVVVAVSTEGSALSTILGASPYPNHIIKPVELLNTLFLDDP